MIARDSLKKLALVSLVVAIGGVALGGFLFRATSKDTDTWGVVTYRYRWGALRFVELDVDRNGEPEARYRVPTDRDYHDWHFRYVEGWEASRCGARFDRHWWLDASGVFRYERDLDGDGDYEVLIEGQRARTLFERSPPLECRPPNRDREPEG